MLRIVIATLLLAGCTTAKTMMVDDRTAMISARDSGWGDSADVLRKVLVTAAQMARARGFEMFQVEGVQDTTKSGYVPIMGSSTTTGYGTAYCSAAWCRGYGTSTTTGTPGYLAPYTQIGANVLVRFYHAGELPDGTPHTYSASAILSSAK